MASDLGPEPPLFVLAPSDLTFLLHECVRCFYNKVVLGRRRPSTPMPAVFTKMDRQQRRFLDGRHTGVVHVDLRSGVLHCEDLALRSSPLALPSGKGRVVFRGAIDACVEFDDGTWGIIDFKTTDPSERSVHLYTLQLHAYALAAESPAFGNPQIGPVTELGLLCFEPREMIALPDKDVAFRAKPTWIPVKRDDAGFLSFIDLIVQTLLLAAKPPAPSSGCPWCDWLAKSA